MNFIGHYKAVGVCKLIERNRTAVRMDIKPASDWTQLPTESLIVIFNGYENFDTDSFFAFAIPGAATIKDPESSKENPVQMTYSTEIKNSISSQNIFHEKYGDRVERFTLSPSSLGGPIWDLEYTTGAYMALDKCQFMKTK